MKLGIKKTTPGTVQRRPAPGHGPLVVGAIMLLAAATSAMADPAESFTLHIPLAIDGPERIDLERVVDRRYGLDLDGCEIRAFGLRAASRHGHGRARLRVGQRLSAGITIGARWADYHIPPPATRGTRWTVSVSGPVQVSAITLTLEPRGDRPRVYDPLIHARTFEWPATRVIVLAGYRPQRYHDDHPQPGHLHDGRHDGKGADYRTSFGPRHGRVAVPVAVADRDGHRKPIMMRTGRDR